MSKPSETRSDRIDASISSAASTPSTNRKWLRRCTAVVTAVGLVGASIAMLQMPSGASAGVTTGGDDRVAVQDAVPGPRAEKGQGGTATYQLRCWQYGRLLFDESPVTLGAETRQGARLVAIDRRGAPLLISDAGTTTCLARAAAPAPNLALPR